jgi:hypothetical protein
MKQDKAKIPTPTSTFLLIDVPKRKRNNNIEKPTPIMTKAKLMNRLSSAIFYYFIL